MNVQYFQNFNELDFDENNKKNKVHIRKIQRNGKKCVTIVEGLENDLDIKKITKALKKIYKCNGTVVIDDKNQEIIQLSGDQINNVKDFLIQEQINDVQDIILH